MLRIGIGEDEEWEGKWSGVLRQMIAEEEVFKGEGRGGGAKEFLMFSYLSKQEYSSFFEGKEWRRDGNIPDKVRGFTFSILFDG